jgi:hypothetical protein
MSKNNLPNNLINIIYEYDNTYYLKFNKCLEQIKNNKNLPFWSVSWKLKKDFYFINPTANNFDLNNAFGYGKHNMTFLKALEICISLNHDSHRYNRYNHGAETYIQHKPKFIGDDYFWKIKN